MAERIEKYGLRVARSLFDMIEHEALPGTGVAPERFWRGFSELIHGMAPRNRELLARRDALQTQIDQWHRERAGQPHDAAAYKAFLIQIGYLVPEGPDFQIETAQVDPEIARIPGPQLVVPVMNARYALNAATARCTGVLLAAAGLLWHERPLRRLATTTATAAADSAPAAARRPLLRRPSRAVYPCAVAISRMARCGGLRLGPVRGGQEALREELPRLGLR